MSIVDTTEATALSVEDRIASKFVDQGTSAEAEPAETQDPAADLAEIDVDGDLFQVPLKLKDAFMRNQDYTQKTQALAEKSKSIDHARELAEQSQIERAFYEAVVKEQQEISVIDAYLQQAQKQDWVNMPESEYRRQRDFLSDTKERRAVLEKSIETKRQQSTEQYKTRLSELKLKARELASKSIPGFNDQMEKDIRTFGQAQGLSETEVDNVLLDPRSFSILSKAMQFDKVKAGATQVRDKTGRFLKPGVASERVPAKTVSQLNLRKALSAAKTPGQKAGALEQHVANFPMFNRGN